MKRMRILILRSNPISPEPRVEKTARALAEAGYSVTCLGWDRSASLPLAEEKDGYIVLRLPIAAQYGTGMNNLFALARWQWQLLAWLVRRRNEIDIIHACDFDTVLPAVVLKALWKRRLVYDIFDFYAEHLRNTPQFIKKLIRSMDFWAISAADGVILVDESRSEQIRGSRPKSCMIIYNTPEDEPGEYQPIYEAPSRYSLRVAYAGLLQVERGLLEMIDVIRRHPEWHLDVVGYGGDERLIVGAISGVENISWHGRVPYREALAISRQADILFATYDPSIANHRYSSPNKIFEAMMLAKPIIVAENTHMDTIVRQADIGLVIKYGEKVALENALSLLQNDLPARKRFGLNGRRAYEEKYGWRIMKQNLLMFYNQVAQSDPVVQP